MQRFYLPNDVFSGNYAIIEDQEIIKQLINVLRAKEGQKFGLFDNSGYEYLGQLVDLNKKQAKLLVIDKQLGRRELKVELTLFQSLLKADKLEWVIQKAVELGVSKFVPVVSRHCVSQTLTENKLRRYNQIIKEATEQCGGVKLMELARPLAFEQALTAIKDFSGEKIICWEQEIAKKIQPITAKRGVVFVGPEGGYSQEEIDLANNCKVCPVSLGVRILRAETAAVVVLAKIID